MEEKPETEPGFGWKKWRTPIAIAIVSWIASQFILWQLGAGMALQLVYCGGYAFVLVAGSRNFGFVFIYRVMLPLLFGLLMVWLYREAYNMSAIADFLSASAANITYLNWLFDILSTLYAICTAFLLWKGLTDHDTLRKILSDEANYIERLVGYLHYFDQKKEANRVMVLSLLENLRGYIGNILVDEGIQASEENTRILRASVDLIASFEPEDHNDRVAVSETMKSLSDLAMARSKRISQMEIKMSPYLLMALAIMSLTVVYPFFTEAPSGSDYVREMCIMILGSILSFLIITLLDISRPFNGFWKIKTDAFVQARKVIAQECETLDCGASGNTGSTQ